MIARALAAAALLCLASPAGATLASGRHWQLSIHRTACERALLTIGMQVRYLGAKGLAEAPVARLVDAKANAHPPKSLVWSGGSRELARWLAAGGVSLVESGAGADVELRFDVGGASGELRLEFGDIAAFRLTRAAGCESLLRPQELDPPRRPRPAGRAAAGLRIYRASYPCVAPRGELRVTEADHPPHLPRQLLVLGHGYLPSTRQVELPMGTVRAQPYAYAGLDELDAVDAAVRRHVAEDFPRYLSPRYFAFNWGVQKTGSGNEAYSVGLYELRRCG